MIDADAIVRDVQRPGSDVLTEIIGAFGAQMLDSDGALNRAALAAVVFGDPAALARLNAIVHPAVRAESAKRFAEARKNPATVVVYDVPLLVEARVDDPWDMIVVAHAPEEARVARLVAHRAMDEQSARTRVAAQATDEERLSIADVVIDTSGTLDDTLRQADELWERLRPGEKRVWPSPPVR